MSTVADGLVLALRALPKAEKSKIIGFLWEDPDFEEAMAHFVVEKLLEWHRIREVKPPPPLVNRLELNLTPKEKGKRLRESYISELQSKGIRIDQVDNLWAKTKTPSNLWVAIPYATERKPNRWFLGVPENMVNERIHKGGVAVILLCQSESGSVLDFVLPPSKVEQIVDKLSKSKGQLKFNMKKVGNSYQLVLPRTSPLDISDYKGVVSILRS